MAVALPSNPSAHLAELLKNCKFTVFIYKKDGVPYDKFVKWATEGNPKEAVPVFAKYGMAQVTQIRTIPEWAELETGYAANGNVDIGHFVVAHEKILFKENA
ncbi:hypothetical protein B0T24DRAFT_588769 [Lasiosphaeria ovina]|uniref:Uncharacterized protein n=1 Tax=Lasiosphaeria ovina TaxID=92902 RepID=A0AAE0NMC9_9PEZI|nr:hypothetical protein B0T24DRAFT_588769 [Lasiosphaeria ovina]